MILKFIALIIGHCYFCGGNLHANRAYCPARDAICHNCSKKGHFMKVCQNSNLSTIYPPSLFKNLSKDTKPIATKSRSFNKDDQAFIKNQISSLLEEGLIQRSDSPWCAQLLIVKDELQRHKKRMCIDYS